MNSFIEKYKKWRKYRVLSHSYLYRYAFVGIGNHSLNNLYPVLEYLGVSLKYIVTASKKTADIINGSGKYKAVDDFSIALKDEEVRGIFISASPENHFNLSCRSLRAGKNVFVEKPPCSNSDELEELIRLEKETGRSVVVGMQKRYAPASSILKKKLKKTEHYIYRYCTGLFPEGNDILTELFIHPLDLIVFLFGKVKEFSLIRTDKTLLLHVIHKEGIKGSVELSTSYSWLTAYEQMTVVEADGIYELNDFSELLCKRKSPRLGNIPLEKVINFIPETKILFNQNMFQPVMKYNNIYINGFYSELEAFISICEGNGTNKNYSGPVSLRSTYKLLDDLRAEMNYRK